MTRDDERAEGLAAWLRTKGHKCRVSRWSPVVDAAVHVEDTAWEIVCVNYGARTAYFPSQKVGAKIRFLDPVKTRPQVLALLAE